MKPLLVLFNTGAFHIYNCANLIHALNSKNERSWYLNIKLLELKQQRTIPGMHVSASNMQLVLCSTAGAKENRNLSLDKK